MVMWRVPCGAGSDGAMWMWSAVHHKSIMRCWVCEKKSSVRVHVRVLRLNWIAKSRHHFRKMNEWTGVMIWDALNIALCNFSGTSQYKVAVGWTNEQTMILNLWSMIHEVYTTHNTLNFLHGENRTLLNIRHPSLCLGWTIWFDVICRSNSRPWNKLPIMSCL